MRDCRTCAHWDSGCGLPVDRQIERHSGTIGDDSGTVQGWRSLVGLRDRPTAVKRSRVQWGSIPCPGHQETP